MKKIFILFASISFLNAKAQQQIPSNHNHLSDKFSYSVFSNSHTISPIKRADIGTYDKLYAQFPSWMILTDKWTGGFTELNGKPIAVSGKSLLDKAQYLMKSKLSIAGVKAEEWILTNEVKDTRGANILHFEQIVDGKKVAFAYLHFRFDKNGNIARINMQGYGSPDNSLASKISKDDVLKNGSVNLDGAIVSSKYVLSDMVWFPIPSSQGYLLHPAYQFIIEGKIDAQNDAPLNIHGYVDAITGDLLYRDNETKDAINVTLKGSVYVDGYTNPKSFVGLPHVTATIGSSTTLIADDTGLIGSATVTIPASVKFSLQGPWSTVRTATDSSKIPSFTKTISTSTSIIDSFATSTKVTSRHLNAYYHVNTIHDFMKKIYGTSFTGMDYSLRTNIDVTGTCNAFYTSAGSEPSINFYPAGGGCVSFAEVRDVVYHEYGHAIVSKMYPGGMKNGGLNEGQADVWSMGITKDSIMARNSMGVGSYIRRYDAAPKVYPIDLTGEVHANGEIIAGAWWDVAKNIGNVDTMSNLFARTLLNEQPDGANGTEGKVYYDMLIGALINDDDNSDLSDGTPHFNQIVSAFARHGIYLLQDIDIAHDEVGHQANGVPIDIKAKVTMSNPIFFKTLNLTYRTRGGTWATIAMTDKGSKNFEAVIPAQASGAIIDYYFSAEDIVNYTGVYWPQNYFPTTVAAETKVTIPYQFAVGLNRHTVVDFESTLEPAWKLGISGDNAVKGNWIQAVPVGSYNYGKLVQTNKDHTSGSGKCLVTGNTILSNPYTQSVQNGTTTIQTPEFDLSSYNNPIISYYRWFSNDQGNYVKYGTWRVNVYPSAISMVTKTIENTDQADHQWRRRVINPKEYFPGVNTFVMRFLATDITPSGAPQRCLVEAAVDDFIIYEATGSTGVNENSIAKAAIYPNPTSDMINVKLPTNTDANEIKLYDLQGKLISSITTQKGVTEYHIDTKLISVGQYFITIIMGKTIQNSLITIVR